MDTLLETHAMWAVPARGVCECENDLLIAIIQSKVHDRAAEVNHQLIINTLHSSLPSLTSTAVLLFSSPAVLRLCSSSSCHPLLICIYGSLQVPLADTPSLVSHG